MRKTELHVKGADVMIMYTLFGVCGAGLLTFCRNNGCFTLYCSVPAIAKGFVGNILFILYKYLVKQILLLHYSSDKETKTQRSEMICQGYTPDQIRSLKSTSD